MAFHIAAGTVGVLSGAAVLAVRKGGHLHRRLGVAFAISMLAMSASGAVIAAVVRPSRLNLLAGLLTFYLVATGWRAGRRPAAAPGPWDAAGLVLALAVGVVGVASGGMACFVFGSAALVFAASDVRLFARGGVPGRLRLARHLWRMGLALWIAVSSLFLGQARVFPAAIRQAHLLPIPVLIVAVVTVFWLCKVRIAGAQAAPRGKEFA